MYRILGYLLLVNVFFTSNVAKAETLVIANVSSPEQLLGSLLLEEIYKRAGHSVVFKTLPSKRALIVSSTGKVNGEANRIYAVGERYSTLKRVPTAFSYFDASAFISDKKVILKEGDWESIRGYSTSYQKGVLYAEIGLKGFPNVKGANTNTQQFQMLDTHRIDVVIATSLDGRVLLKKLNLKNVIGRPTFLQRLKIYHYLHESKAYLIPELDKVIIEMKRTGELAKLRKKTIEKIFNELYLNVS